MTFKTITIFIGLIICLNVHSQQLPEPSNKCNLETIKQLRVHKDSMTDKLVNDFLFSIDKSCRNHVEWSEASNWTLFWLADIETKRFLHLLKSNKEKIDTEWVIEEFKQPITDGIDLVRIYNKISNLNDKDDLTLKILDSIKLAAKKSGIEIK